MILMAWNIEDAVHIVSTVDGDKMKLIVYMDGLCEPRNPGGVACYGWIFSNRRGYGVVENNSTNNIAEYNALISVMKYLIQEGITGPVEFRGDSKLVINQMNGLWKIKKPHIQELVTQAKKLSKQFDTVSFTWVPREQNELTDELSRKAYYAYRRKLLREHEETVVL